MNKLSIFALLGLLLVVTIGVVCYFTMRDSGGAFGALCDLKKVKTKTFFDCHFKHLTTEEASASDNCFIKVFGQNYHKALRDDICLHGDSKAKEIQACETMHIKGARTRSDDVEKSLKECGQNLKSTQTAGALGGLCGLTHENTRQFFECHYKQLTNEEATATEQCFSRLFGSNWYRAAFEDICFHRDSKAKDMQSCEANIVKGRRTDHDQVEKSLKKCSKEIKANYL